jgi:hypothetical protein
MRTKLDVTCHYIANVHTHFNALGFSLISCFAFKLIDVFFKKYNPIIFLNTFSYQHVTVFEIANHLIKVKQHTFFNINGVLISKFSL